MSAARAMAHRAVSAPLMQIFPVAGVDHPGPRSAADWAALAMAGGKPDELGMNDRRCAFMAGFCAANEGRGFHENPFLHNGGDRFIAEWNSGHRAGPHPSLRRGED